MSFTFYFEDTKRPDVRSKVANGDLEDWRIQIGFQQQVLDSVLFLSWKHRSNLDSMDHYLYSQHQEHQKSILLPNRIEHSTISGPGTETYSERITTRPMRLFRAQNISMFQKTRQKAFYFRLRPIALGSSLQE
ncbi:unnamed protein product [Albugo candida]|uniref:Uncharacterized protein n=1 Tax=Albugo candida TaxID=65357 RepID=A0A024GQN6_9STRA|nr:unnamed protein product [Albugo candida]|eukprot:CCI48856.1 unnamed protein product [Albugo candida]